MNLIGQTKSFNRLWKIGALFEILNATFSKFYNPSDNLAIDEVIVFFKGSDFQKVHSKKTASVLA